MPKQEWKDWILKLDASIWKHRPAQYYANMSGTYHSYTRSEASRRLTLAEWKKLSKLVESEGLVCEMTNACMGFGFGVRLHHSPSYPGLKPEFLLCVTTDHFEDKTKTRSSDYDREWARFEKLVYAPKNIELLVFHGLGMPKSKTYYDY